MGRRKIAIEPITEERNRTVTFVKRKAGLFKKAHELSILCQVDVLVIIVGHNHKVYEFSSTDTQGLLDKYNNTLKLQECKKPKDYGDYDKISRISEYPGKRRNNNNNINKVKNKIKHEEEEDSVEDENDVEDDEVEQEEDSVEDDEEEEDDDDEGDSDEDGKSVKLSSRLRKRHNDTPSKPSKLRKLVSSTSNTSMDQSRIQSTFQHQRVLLQQQLLYGSLPPLSSFPVQASPQMKYQQLQQQNTQPQQQQQQQQANKYAPSPAYSSPSSNGGGGSGTTTLKTQSQRPILRVKIPSSSDNNDQDTNNEDDNDNGSNMDINNRKHKNDSAMTLTAMDSSKDITSQDTNNQTSNNNNNNNSTKMTIENGQLAPPKPILPGIGNGVNVIPTSTSTANIIHHTSSSSKSTPISATAPNGLFILPQPQPSPSGSHTNNIFLSPFNNNNNNNNNSNNTTTTAAAAAGNNNNNNNTNENTTISSLNNTNFKSSQYTGETPLSALPSKYLNNDLLFLSPSNFYSNEWNIPFGSGTPIMSNRIQQQQQQQQQQLMMMSNNNSGNSNILHGNIQNMNMNENIRLPSPSQLVGGTTFMNNSGNTKKKKK